MQKLIVALCIVGAVIAGPPPPECMRGPPTEKTPKECCQLPELIPQNILEQCKASNPKPHPPAPGMPPTGCCMSECVMNTTGILMNGKFDKPTAVKYLTERMAGDAEGIKVATAAVDHCEKESNSKKSEFDDMAKMAMAGEKVCNMISGFMLGCVHGQVFKNCPKDKYGASSACDGIKAYVDKCGFLLPMKQG